MLVWDKIVTVIGIIGCIGPHWRDYCFCHQQHCWKSVLLLCVELCVISAAGPGGTVPLHQSGTTVGGPPKPKQPPQILPKPPAGQPSSGSHTKIAANSRSTTSTQHQGTLHCYKQSDKMYKIYALTRFIWKNFGDVPETRSKVIKEWTFLSVD
jgi:hypothetical protein